MVPAHSIKVSRVSMYSGFRHVVFPFAYGAFTLSGRLSQNLSARINESIMRSEPHGARTMVWPLSISLAATLKIEFSFSSSGYLDVSVHRLSLIHISLSAPEMLLWVLLWWILSQKDLFRLQTLSDCQKALSAQQRALSALWKAHPSF